MSRAKEIDMNTKLNGHKMKNVSLLRMKVLTHVETMFALRAIFIPLHTKLVILCESLFKCFQNSTNRPI